MSLFSRSPLSLQLRDIALNILLLITLVALAYSTTASLARTAVAAPQLDVPYVPTRPEVVSRMLEMANVQSSDYLIDLGSGDGRIVVAAVRDHNVKSALGIDLDPQRIAEAKQNAQNAGISDRVTFEQGDLFKKDFSEADVLTMYLLQTVNLRLRPVILEKMKPGARVVSHAFDMGDWQPDQHDNVNGSNVYLWIVPAKVEGRWQVKTADGKNVDVTLTQTYQEISGNAVVDGNNIQLTNASLHGERIKFSVGDDEYVGKVNGSEITPMQGEAGVKGWHARRI